MAKIDYEYQTTEAQVLRYQKVPLLDRLRWLEELCVFTKMVRQAPANHLATNAQTSTKARQRTRSAR